MPWAALKHKHPSRTLLTQVVDKKSRKLTKEESKEGAATEFQAYGRPQETLMSLKYLGHFLIETGDDWPSAINNLQKAWNIWNILLMILGRECKYTQTLKCFYLAIV